MVQCTKTVATERMKMWRSSNHGWCAIHSAGTTKITIRIALAPNAGQVFPIAWKRLEQGKVTTAGMKFHERYVSNVAATAITAGDAVKNGAELSACHCTISVSTAITTAP